MNGVDGGKGMVSESCGVGSVIARDIVECEVCGGAEDMLDGAESMPVEVGGVKEVVVGDGVDVSAEVGVRAYPVWDGFGEANGRGSRGADV